VGERSAESSSGDDARNLISGQVANSFVLQTRDIHIHVPLRLRKLLERAGSNYLTDKDYAPDERTAQRRAELADQLVRFVIENPVELHAAISETADTTADTPSEPWVADEAVALLSLVEQRLAETRIAQQTHTEVAERMAVELMQLRLQVSAQQQAERARAESADRAAEPPAPMECPYPGLAAFTASQADWFFGREQLTAQLVRRLAVARAAGLPLFVVGVSGAGKSSLLHAGLVPALRRGDIPAEDSADWLHVQVRPGERPLAKLVTRMALLARIPDEAKQAEVRAHPERLAVLMRQAARVHATERGQDGVAGPVLLIVDQFEEIFTECGDDVERARFLKALLATARRVGDHRTTPAAVVVLGLRADFFPACAGEPDLAAILQDNQFLVGPMSPPELRRVVTGPAAAVGLALDPGLVDLILDELGSGPGTEGYEPGVLPLLAYALAATWASRQGSTMTLASYQTSGGVRGAIATAAEAMFTAMSGPERQTTRTLLLRLVAVGDNVEDTRRRVPRATLTGGDPQAHAMLQRLVLTRLVTITEDDHVEIVHEALLRAWPRLTEWLHTDRAGLLVHRQLADAAKLWSDGGRDRYSLYAGARLADLRAWLDGRMDRTAQLSRLERDFVQASVAAEAEERERVRRNTRRLRRRVVALAVLVVITLVATTVALWQRQVANGQRADALHQAAIALSGEYATESLSAGSSDPRRSMLLALAAWQAAPTEEARSALLSTQTSPYAGSLGPTAGRLWNVAITPDGRIAALATYEGIVTLWDTTTRRQIVQFAGLNGMNPDVAFSPDGHVLAVTGLRRAIQLWDVRTDRIVRTLPVYGANIAFSADGAYLVTAGAGAPVTLWNIRTGQAIRKIADPAAYSVAISHDGTLIATGDLTGAVRLWQIATGAPFGVLSGHTKAVTSVDFDRDDSLLASGSADGTVRLWNVARRAPANVPMLTPPGGNEYINQAALSPDGHYVAAALDRTRNVVLWRISNGAVVTTLIGHTQGVSSVAFSGDGHTLLSGSLDETAILWHLQSAYLFQPDPVNGVAFSPDGQLIASSSGQAVTLWDARRRIALRSMSDSIGGTASVAFSADSRTVAAADQDGTVRIWDVGTGALTRTFTLGDGMVPTFVAFSPDGRTLAAVGGPTFAAITSGTTPLPYTYVVRQWDVVSGAVSSTTSYVIHDAATDPYPSTAPVFTPDSKLLAIPLTNGFVELRQARIGALVNRIAIAPGTVTAPLAFSSNGMLLAAGSTNRTLGVWNVTTGQRVGTPMAGQNGVITGVAFLPGDHVLASTSDYDSTVRLWDVSSDTALAAIQGMTGTFNGVAAQPGGGLIAAAQTNSAVEVVNTDTNSVLSQLCTALRGTQSITAAWSALGLDPTRTPHC
jgi:WD40 repeat protein